tara:strand:- start:3458 stop:3592 length:135 start_codon:yes stop_codon:yes gene_type:complete
MKKRRKINEALSSEHADEIRKLIRTEIAQIFFELYRKKSVWSKP